MTTVEVILPWFGTERHRTAAAHWVISRLRLTFPTWTLTVATVEPPESGPWCKARAVMPAVEQSTADIVVVSDADCWCSCLDEAVIAVASGRHSWAAPHWRTHRFTPGFTERVLNGADPSVHSSESLEERPALGVPGGGIVVGRRDVLLDTPLDRRFLGWGGEDWSWGKALRTLHGRPWRGAAPLYHLWHPPQDRPGRKILPPDNDALRRRYALAYGKPAAMRALIDEIDPGAETP